MYHSANIKDQSLRLDFPINDVYIEKFYLKSAINRDPYNWIFEGSKDAVNFIPLYNNTNKKLCDKWELVTEGDILGCPNNQEKEYSVDFPDFYKSLRIRQTGKDSSNQTILIFSGLDIYGNIKINTFSHYIKCNIQTIIIYFVIIVVYIKR